MWFSWFQAREKLGTQQHKNSSGRIGTIGLYLIFNLQLHRSNKHSYQFLRFRLTIKVKSDVGSHHSEQGTREARGLNPTLD